MISTILTERALSLSLSLISNNTFDISCALGLSHLYMAKQLVNDIHVCNVMYGCRLLAIGIICIDASQNHCSVCWNI